MINRSDRVARVYAEALIAIGREQGLVERIHEELTALASLSGTDPQMRAFFTSPRIAQEKKYEVLKKILEGQVCPPVLGLLRVLIRKRRETILDNVADLFGRFKDEAEGKVHVFVTTARALLDDQREAITARVATATGKGVLYHEKADPALIGGTVVRVGDYVVDGSIRRRLKALRKNLVAKGRLFE
ncbi:MAG: ATP synthase F1 subunit delta [Planctomycetes bacterium]|jgi:F-type H+-transporting ATPase subunit delta|nr:ATP synthase F1 subunit delta [Planctomycetota bacterium]